jgi:predicted DNA binding CopG/RHH family protein
MNEATLDAEEREILAAYHAGALEPAPLSPREIDEYRAAARATARKDARVNIRLSSQVLDDFKVRALEEGIPYQTLMASVLHKFVSGKLVAR